MSVPNSLAGQIVEIYGRLAELERRARNRKRTGTIAEVDTARGLARVRFSRQGGADYLGPWMPWKEIASGDIRTHVPPSAGEQVDVLSESGDLADGVIDMSIPSNAMVRPHDGAEAAIVKGATRILIGDGAVAISANVTIKGSLAVDGGGVTNNGTDIGNTHRHGGVVPGPGTTDVPI